jgi:hypothetical protein
LIKNKWIILFKYINHKYLIYCQIYPIITEFDLSVLWLISLVTILLIAMSIISVLILLALLS